MAYRNKRKLSSEEIKMISDLANTIPPHYKVDRSGELTLRTVPHRGTYAEYLKQGGPPMPGYSSDSRVKWYSNEPIEQDYFPILLDVYCKKGPEALTEAYKKALEEYKKISEQALAKYNQQNNIKDGTDKEVHNDSTDTEHATVGRADS